MRSTTVFDEAFAVGVIHDPAAKVSNRRMPVPRNQLPAPVTLTLTRHARQRIKQRLGLHGQRAIERRMHEAFWKGTQNVDITGLLAHWIESRRAEHGTGNATRIHLGFAWIFESTRNSTILINVIPIPEELI
jgi:hypothetical protein